MQTGFDCLNRSAILGCVIPIIAMPEAGQSCGRLTQKTIDSVFECRLLLRGFIERFAKADGRGPHRASQKRPFVERRRTPCRYTWQPPAPSAAAPRWWSPTRATLGERITPSTCGVCVRRVIAAGLTGKGLDWYGSTDPEIWPNNLWDFASEGVDSLITAESDRRRGESRVAAAAAVVHYAPGDSPLCGLEESPEPMTPDPELVRRLRRLS